MALLWVYARKLIIHQTAVKLRLSPGYSAIYHGFICETDFGNMPAGDCYALLGTRSGGT